MVDLMAGFLGPAKCESADRTLNIVDIDEDDHEVDWNPWKPLIAGDPIPKREKKSISIELGDFTSKIWLANLKHFEVYWNYHYDSTGNVI